MSEQVVENTNQRIVDAMNKWSIKFFSLLLPSGLGTKVTIKDVTDEGSKVLSMGIYSGKRSAQEESIPYDGSTYEGHAIKDESRDSLWLYEASPPNSFEPYEEGIFHVSLGHVFKCHTCRGQGRITCKTCGGKVRWTKYLSDGREKHYTCSCGDGKQDCSTCTGYGEMLKILSVKTRYTFDEKKYTEYSGKLPESLLIDSSGSKIFEHACEYRDRVISEAMDGFDSSKFSHLMTDAHSEIKSSVSSKATNKIFAPSIINNLIDKYFTELPNLATGNKRLSLESLPIRMKCEVTDVPVKDVTYEYKGKQYSLYVYGDKNDVWVDGKKPAKFTWKLAIVIGVLILTIGFIVFMQL